MGKRIRNYRSGDRAEDLGVFLMKAFCAMAPIPRQEDFGLADAVATLLRLEGKFWYAEGSFLVQFHGRDGNGGSKRHEGTWEELKQKGFDPNIEVIGSNAKVALNFERHFAKMPIPHKIIEGPKETPTLDPGDYSPCFFLGRLPPEPKSTGEE